MNPGHIIVIDTVLEAHDWRVEKASAKYTDRVPSGSTIRRHAFATCDERAMYVLTSERLHCSAGGIRL